MGRICQFKPRSTNTIQNQTSTKGSLKETGQFLSHCIHTVFSLYTIYRYLANLHSILPRIFCRYRMCSHRKPKISIFVQMAPIIIITMHWRPQISWRSILQRRAQRSHQQNTTEMSFCSIRVLMLVYSIHNTKKKGWWILLKYSPSILFSFTCSLRKISAF